MNLKNSRIIASIDNYSMIPGSPIAYWVPKAVFEDFVKFTSVSDIGEAKAGMTTGDNNRFLRLWFEVCQKKIGFHYANRDEALLSKKKWFPYNKGGGFRKWYGLNEYVVLWENDGSEIKNATEKGRKIASVRSERLYFKQSITWATLASNTASCRFSEVGHLFDDKGSSCFMPEENLHYTLALINSNVGNYFLQILNPTMSFQSGNIGALPIVTDCNEKNDTVSLSKENITISKNDWDSLESSWDFLIHPLTGGINMGRLISDKYLELENECRRRFDKLKANEEALNRIFIDIYGLQDELTPEVEDKDVTVRLADKERDIKSLISYLIGVIMGRYSLDVDGLAYAGGDWDASKYISYQPDDDGIVPIYSGIGMEDGLTARITQLIKKIYGEDTYRQNMDFIAESLGKTNNESSEETLNRYLNDGFYADHLKIYQKRPIYWMFSSGKNSGFKCLVYMHRYTEDTLALINGKYFLPESTRLKNDVEELLSRISTAEGRDKIRLEKERQKLSAAYNEAIEYGQVLDHMANKYIAIDLDDGVKVNYAKFQDVELVTDSGTKVKKDLLVPIK